MRQPATDLAPDLIHPTHHFSSAGPHNYSLATSPRRAELLCAPRQRDVAAAAAGGGRNLRPTRQRREPDTPDQRAALADPGRQDNRSGTVACENTRERGAQHFQTPAPCPRSLATPLPSPLSSPLPCAPPRTHPLPALSAPWTIWMPPGPEAPEGWQHKRVKCQPYIKARARPTHPPLPTATSRRPTVGSTPQ